MHHRSMKRVLFVVLLAGGLAVAGPAQAHAAPVDGPRAIWKWLERIWEEKVTVVWERSGPGRGDGGREKGGVCIGPNGCSPNSAMMTVGPTCRAGSEGGVCIDPNG